MKLPAKTLAWKSSGLANPIRLPETFTDKIFPESKSGQMQQTLIPTNFLTSISSVLDSLVRHFPLPDNVKDLKMPEVHSFLKLHGLQKRADHRICCLKTLKEYSLTKKGELLEESSKSLMNYTMMSKSAYITLRITYHRTGHVSSLSALLEPPEKVPEKYYLSDKQMQTLINLKEKHRKKGNGFGPQFIKDKAYTITSHYSKDPYDNLVTEPKKLTTVINSDNQSKRVYNIDGIAPTLTSASGGWGAKSGLYAIPVLTPFREKKRQNGRRFKTDGEPAFTITCQDQHGVFDGFRIRRLMPIECERLQGFKDNYTKFGATGKEISDSQRYKCLGNAVSIPVVKHIMERIIKNI